MISMATTNIDTAPPMADDSIQAKKEPTRSPVGGDDDFEIRPADDVEKTYFNKLSVWLMVLFSGLAIGSDG